MAQNELRSAPSEISPGGTSNLSPMNRASLEGDSSPSNVRCVRCYPQRRGGGLSPAPPQVLDQSDEFSNEEAQKMGLLV